MKTRILNITQVLFASLAAFLLVACGGGQKDSFTIGGQLDGLQATDTLWLFGADNLFDRIDTLAVSDKGSFEVELPIDTLVAAWLELPGGAQVPVFIGRGYEIQISGKAQPSDSVRVRGGEENDLLDDFLTRMASLSSKSVQNERIQRQLQDSAQAFIKRNPGSLASIYLLKRYFVDQPQPDLKRIEGLIEGLDGELKDRAYTDRLSDRLTQQLKTGVGKTIPYFRLPNAKGDFVTRNTFRDKYILVHFWASWDQTSVDSLATMRSIYKKEKKNKHLALLGISLDQDKKAWHSAIKRDTLDWEQLCDFKAWETELIKQLHINTLPTTLLLTPTGRIEYINPTRTEIDQRLKRAEEEAKAREERERQQKKLSLKKKK